jgi:hypothetical protein
MIEMEGGMIGRESTLASECLRECVRVCGVRCARAFLGRAFLKEFVRREKRGVCMYVCIYL